MTIVENDLEKLSQLNSDSTYPVEEVTLENKITLEKEVTPVKKEKKKKRNKEKRKERLLKFHQKLVQVSGLPKQAHDTGDNTTA